MRIIGCDFHSRYQQIAMLETETGEVVERRLEHENGEARSFYARLPQPVRVRIEATGYTQWFKRLLQELERLPLDRWASRRRRELPELYDRLNQPIAELDQAVRQEAYGNASAVRLMTHPGVGPLTSLTFVLTMGPASRFARGKKVASYLVLNPREDSSGGHRRAGAISKQGSSLLRWLLVEAGQDGRATRSRTPLPVSTGEISPRQSDRQGGRGPQADGAVVLDAAQPEGLRTWEERSGSHAGQLE